MDTVFISLGIQITARTTFMADKSGSLQKIGNAMALGFSFYTIYFRLFNDWLFP